MFRTFRIIFDQTIREDNAFNYDREKKIGSPGKYFSYGVACSEVEIDVLTGENQVCCYNGVFLVLSLPVIAYVHTFVFY